MAHPCQHISNLAEILYRQGVEDIVISPGSRNAPLINAFYKRFGTKCSSIVDERSAAYYALGRSLFTKKPTVLICTSGTAALNYAPAVAEAFYQGIPLIVLTADRPPELIGQQDNQTIFQNNLYGLNIKAGFTFPDTIKSGKDVLDAGEITNEAFLLSVSERQGPVQINVPLREPLYGELPDISEDTLIYKEAGRLKGIPVPDEFLKAWNTAKSIMVVCGQMPPDKELFDSVSVIKNDKRVVVIAEAVSNLHQVAGIQSPDIVFEDIDYPEEYLPEMVIYFGGQVVSKKLKAFLRKLKQSGFYFLENSCREVDTFQNLKSAIKIAPAEAFKLLPVQKGGYSAYKDLWQKENQNKKAKAEEFLQKSISSDLKVFGLVNQNLPDEAILFSGNSSAVRYLLCFSQKGRDFYANRGASGIDGSLSTAVGFASAAGKPVFAVLGDLSFVYDSNALWNREFPSNLKIIVINNGGGGIFHLINGPTGSDAFKMLVEAYHPVKIDKLAEAFGISYYFCSNFDDVGNSIKLLRDSMNPCILEIKTPDGGNPEVTKSFFNYLNG